MPTKFVPGLVRSGKTTGTIIVAGPSVPCFEERPGLGTLATDRRAGERKTLLVNRSVRTDRRQARRPPVAAFAAGGGALAGLCIGFGLARMMDAPHARMTGMLAIAAGIAIASALPFVRVLARADASRLEKNNATRRAIEHALAAPGCAVAHSVRTIARAGVIDHLVATPVRLWVITAIDWRVSREELLHILAAVADNTTAVWDWAPPGTPVRGCLVLGGERRPARTRYDYGKGRSWCTPPRRSRASSGPSPGAHASSTSTSPARWASSRRCPDSPRPRRRLGVRAARTIPGAGPEFPHPEPPNLPGRNLNRTLSRAR